MGGDGCILIVESATRSLRGQIVVSSSGGSLTLRVDNQEEAGQPEVLRNLERPIENFKVLPNSASAVASGSCLSNRWERNATLGYRSSGQQAIAQCR